MTLASAVGRAAALLAAVGLGAGRADAQAPSYSATALACARFGEHVESDIHGEAGGAPRDDTGGRVAVWIVRARGAGAGVDIEAWYDSLSIWRTTGDVRRSPDTDGIVGGRYRGLLSERGVWRPSARPFVPDEIAEFADLHDAFADLFPVLPERALAPGETWRDATVEIQRLGDSVASGVALQRYRLEQRLERRDSAVAGALDTLALQVHQRTTEAGEFVWHPDLGLVRRVRRITVDTEVPAGNGLRHAVRSRLVQRVSLVRLPNLPAGCR